MTPCHLFLFCFFSFTVRRRVYFYPNSRIFLYTNMFFSYDSCYPSDLHLQMYLRRCMTYSVSMCRKTNRNKQKKTKPAQTGNAFKWLSRQELKRLLGVKRYRFVVLFKKTVMSGATKMIESSSRFTNMASYKYV